MIDYEKIEILLVEDSETDAEMTMRALGRKNLANNLVWAKDGAEALDFLFLRGAYASRPNASPKLVLLDLKMPKARRHRGSATDQGERKNEGDPGSDVDLQRRGARHDR